MLDSLRGNQGSPDGRIASFRDYACGGFRCHGHGAGLMKDEVMYMEAPEKAKAHITKTEIDGTLYIVESVSAQDAKEAVCAKIKRLILENVKVSESSKVS